MRRLAPILLLALACDDAGDGPSGPDAALRSDRGDLFVRVDTECATPVVRAGEQAIVRVVSPAPDDSVTELRRVAGPGRLNGGVDTATAPQKGGQARFTLECRGFGRVTLLAVDGERRTAAVEVLCARPSLFIRQCRSGIAPQTPDDWEVEQFFPTGVRGRRLTPRGLSVGELDWRTPLRLRLVFDGNLRPELPGSVQVEVQPGGAAGVEVEPTSAFTQAGTGEVEFELRAGPLPGEFRLKYTATLDGEVRTRTSEPFVVTSPPASTATLRCDDALRPRPVFDALGGLRPDAPGARCFFAVGADGEPPAPDTRAWFLTEAGRASRSRVRLDDVAGFEVFVDPDGARPPVDAAPRGPSPLDGLVTVVGIVEGAEPFDDVDGDGVYTPSVDGFGPAFDIDEPYVDADDDDAYDPGEAFFDTNGDGVWTPANGAHDVRSLLWASERLRWVGPVHDGPRLLELECLAPHCSASPVPGIHEGCPADALAYLLPGAVVDARALPADRNGQCTAEGGRADLFVDPPLWAVFDVAGAPLGPCEPAGLLPTPFELRLKAVARGPFTVGLVLPDGRALERTLCAPTR